MRDSYGREINYLRVSVTDRCNLRCRYCMPADGVSDRGHSGILRSEEIVEICRAASEIGITKIRVTGGEPLIRRGISELCRELASIPGIRELAVTTNGTLLEKFAPELKSAGVSRVNVSLDTLDSDKYRELTRGGELSSVLRGIEAAKREGLTPVKLNCVLMRGINDSEIAEFAALTRDGLTEVRFIELMAIGEAKSIWAERYQSADIVPEIERVRVIDPVSRAFCPTCNRLRLTADGKIKPCLHSATEYNVRGLHGEALTEALARALEAKPAAHNGLTSESPSQSLRGMDRIGG